MLPRLSRAAKSRSMPPQEFSCAHPPLSFQLNIAQRNRTVAGGDDKIVLAAQNLSSVATEADHRPRKDFQILIVELHERAGPRIEGANFSLNCFGCFGPIDLAVFTF